MILIERLTELIEWLKWFFSLIMLKYTTFVCKRQLKEDKMQIISVETSYM